PLAALLLVALVLAMTLEGSASAESQDPAPVAPRRILIVAVPRLSWTDLEGTNLPNFSKLLASGAVADVSLRTIGPRTALGEAYLTIGAGNRATARDSDAGQVLGPNELIEDGTAASTYRRRTGIDPKGAAALQLSIPTIDYTATKMLYGARPGALADELDLHHWSTAIIGNDDIDNQGVADPAAPTGEPTETPPFGATGASPDANGGSGTSTATADPTAAAAAAPTGGQNRPAALAVMDHDGQVPAGVVGRRLLRRDAASAYGVRLNIGYAVSTLRKVWKPKTLALVELSDLERADRYSGVATAEQGTKLRDRALALTDAALGRVLAQAGPRDLVVMVTPAAPRAHEAPSPMVVRGPGFDSGVLSSGTTRRTGYVTLPDIAPEILDVLGIAKPNSMNGAPLALHDRGDTSTERWTRFLGWNSVTKFRDHVAGSMGSTYQIVQVIGYVLAVWALTRKPKLKPLVGFLVLATIALAPLTFLVGYFRYDKLGTGGFQLALVAGAAAIAGLAWLAGEAFHRGDVRRRAVLPPLLVVAFTWLVLLGDILTGGKAQINTIFGYSPVVAGRFSGFGNTAYGLFAMATVVLACGGWALLSREERTGGRRLVLLGLVAVVFVVAIVADGYPTLGSDVGGVLSLVPTAGVVILLLRKRPVKLRTVAAILLATVVALGVFAAVDLARPADQQTHLARLVHNTFGGGSKSAQAAKTDPIDNSDGGSTGLFTVLSRKLSANISSITGSSFSTLFPAAVIFLLL
ncbi:MAG TPA: hypothetical protein VGM93_11335, partial [Acidimicrobiales bacterium]